MSVDYEWIVTSDGDVNWYTTLEGFVQDIQRGKYEDGEDIDVRLKRTKRDAHGIDLADWDAAIPLGDGDTMQTYRWGYEDVPIPRKFINQWKRCAGEIEALA